MIKAQSLEAMLPTINFIHDVYVIAGVGPPGRGGCTRTL